MKLTTLLMTFALLAPLPATYEARAQALDRPSLAEFDDAVVQGRRVMRQYCAITQELMGGRQGARSQQLAGAMKALGETRTRWSAIQEKYGANPPAEYARDKDFAGRLQDIADAMEDMERGLAVGESRRSFRSCGYACGLFVAMHEDNGLEYPLDKLFHLRKEIKSAQSLLAAKGVSAVRGRIAGLLAKRDAVLTAPATSAADAPNESGYRQSVRDLSRALDELAIVGTGEDAGRVEKSLAECAALANKAYGLAL